VFLDAAPLGTEVDRRATPAQLATKYALDDAGERMAAMVFTPLADWEAFPDLKAPKADIVAGMDIILHTYWRKDGCWCSIDAEEPRTGRGSCPVHRKPLDITRVFDQIATRAPLA